MGIGAKYFRKSGRESICRYHEKYCGSWRQYTDFDDCMTYLAGIPIAEPTCGERILGGNSILCRFKHHFMVPIAPSKHCYHIGKEGLTSYSGLSADLKCDTVKECDAYANDPDVWEPLRDPLDPTGAELTELQGWQTTSDAEAATLANADTWEFACICPNQPDTSGRCIL